jgi:uncharacterized MAPEG superfamily protein
MTTDLWCLVAFALWGVALVAFESSSKTRLGGVAWSLGNRDAQPDALPPWLQRAGRALNNHKENFPLFATAVLVLHITGHANHLTALGAIVFLVARVLHGVIYMAGITTLRSVVWFVALGANLFMLGQLL